MRKIKVKNVVFSILSSVLILGFLTQSYAQEVGNFVKPEVSYGAMNLRDPFESPMLSESKTNGSQENIGTPDVLPIPLTVQGIIWGSDLLQAIINNKVVKVGETIDGAKIISIEKDFITVFAVNKQFKLLSPALTPAVKKTNTQEASKYSWQSYERKKEDVNER
ncbi:MAG: hypothetical protein V1919_01330 [Candidatus Omnitrophota bacterium]